MLNGTDFQKRNITIKDLSLEYFKYKQDTIEKKTYINYCQRLKLVMKKIGYVKVKDINIKVLENFYYYLRHTYVTRKNKPLSPTTIQHYYALINNMLEYAVKCGYRQDNPNQKIDKPKRSKPKPNSYNPEQAAKLVSILPNEPLKYQAIVLLALDSGCRRGELTGLTWDDIDFKELKIEINKTTQYAYGKIFEKGTKSVNGVRTNFILPYTAEVLKKYQKEQMQKKLRLGSKWQGSKRIFTTNYGADIHPDTLTKIMKNIVEKYDLPPLTLHGLRHTNVSLMISKGVQPQVISRKVGHSSIQVTDQYYSHFYEDEFRDATNSIGDILTVNAQ